MDSWRNRVVVVALMAALAGTALVVSNRPAEKVAEAAPAVQRTTSTTTTTLPPIEVDPNITDLATATGPMVEVYAELPSSFKPDSRATDAGVRLAALLPPTSPERAEAPAIPTLEAPVIGRRATPDGWEFDNPTPWGGALTFVVTEDHGDWLRVEMPIRPNGTQGWIRNSEVTRSTIDTRIEIDLSDRTLKAYTGATLVAETGVVVGAAKTPTPEGRLYVTDYEEKYRGSAYGPWILPLSGYSQTLDEFSGGVPVIALHGTNRPDLIGTAASNGCVRMPDDVIETLRNTMVLGTPVDVRA